MQRWAPTAPAATPAAARSQVADSEVGARGCGSRIHSRGTSRTAFVSAPARERLHVEDDRFVMLELVQINSGYDWYWENFQGNARNFSTIIEDVIPGAPVDVRVCMYGWTTGQHSFLTLQPCQHYECLYHG